MLVVGLILLMLSIFCGDGRFGVGFMGDIAVILIFLGLLIG